MYKSEFKDQNICIIHNLYNKKQMQQSSEKKSHLYSQTMKCLFERKNYFFDSQKQNQYFLTEANTRQIKTISDIFPKLKHCFSDEDYISKPIGKIFEEDSTINENSLNEMARIRHTIDPNSDGEQSITQLNRDQRPGLQTVAKMAIDSRKLQLKEETEDESEWEGNQILLSPLPYSLFPKKKSQIEANLLRLLNEQMKGLIKMTHLFYKGKNAALCTYKGKLFAKKAYESLLNSSNLEPTKCYRVKKNKLRLRSKEPWLAIILRDLPEYIKKRNLVNFVQFLREENAWVEEPFKMGSTYCSLIVVPFMEDAISICNALSEDQNFEKVRANIHPMSLKKWRNQRS